MFREDLRGGDERHVAPERVSLVSHQSLTKWRVPTARVARKAKLRVGALMAPSPVPNPLLNDYIIARARPVYADGSTDETRRSNPTIGNGSRSKTIWKHSSD